MQFTAEAVPGLADGSITTTFRTWSRAQVTVGGVYRKGDLALYVDAVGRVPVGDLTEADARAAGEADLAALRVRLGHPPAGQEVWRVDFHRVDAPDPRRALAAAGDLDAAAVAEIDRRLDRLDRAAGHGAWTRATLHAVDRHPGTVARELAAALGRDRDALKVDVRKLKALGLTESLAVGYRLSPRGVAYLAHPDRRDPRPG